MIGGVVAASFAALAAAAAPKVRLEFYHEALCGGCIWKLQNDLKPMVEARGVADIVDFVDVPFGNAYFEIAECAEGGGFHCWLSKCTSSNPPADCFTADVSCQHGATECWGNTVEACVTHVTNGTATKVIEFAACFEGDSAPTQDLLESCAQKNGIDANAVNTCVKGPLGKKLIGENGKKTAMVDKDRTEIYVPYILLNGKELPSTTIVLNAVCEAYTGPKPPGCPQTKCTA